MVWCHVKIVRCACRQGFKHVLEPANQLIEMLKERGPEKAVDIDDAAQRVALEVVHEIAIPLSLSRAPIWQPLNDKTCMTVKDTKLGL